MNDASVKNQGPVGTSDMPPVEILNYGQQYRVTKLFLNDLKITLQDAPYVEVRRFLDFLKNYNYSLPSAVLNEFLNQLAAMPYKMVSPIMDVIDNKKLFSKYFEAVVPNLNQVPSIVK